MHAEINIDVIELVDELSSDDQDELMMYLLDIATEEYSDIYLAELFQDFTREQKDNLIKALSIKS